MENYIPNSNLYKHFSTINVVSCFKIIKCTEYKLLHNSNLIHLLCLYLCVFRVYTEILLVDSALMMTQNEDRMFCIRQLDKICCCSVAKLYSTLHDPMDCSMPRFPVPHNLPEFAQGRVHWMIKYRISFISDNSQTLVSDSRKLSQSN